MKSRHSVSGFFLVFTFVCAISVTSATAQRTGCQPVVCGSLPQTWCEKHTEVARGLLIYIMVNRVAATIDALIADGGEIVQSIGADAPEITARFRDPAGNVIGLYQQPSRNSPDR
jgi:predicted enzyme related to lactoylglutathione lyase